MAYRPLDAFCTRRPHGEYSGTDARPLLVAHVSEITV
jgi:hypothetical protein